MFLENGYTSDSFEQDPYDDFVVIYELTQTEFVSTENRLSKDEELLRDFASEGVELSFSQVQIAAGI